MDRFRFVLLTFTLSFAAGVSADVYQVGTAARPITPCVADPCATGGISVPAHMPLLGYTCNLIATGADTDLWVRVLTIEDSNGERAVLIAVDTAVFRPMFVARIRRRLQSDYGLHPEQVLVNASHTHSAPSLMLYCPADTCPLNGCTGVENPGPTDAYFDEVQNRIVSAVGDAFENAVEATLHYRRGDTKIGRYRRADAQYYTQPNASGLPRTEDHTQPRSYPRPLDVLEARNTSNQAIAVAFFTGVHPITGMRVSRYSADFPATAREEIEDAMTAAGSTNPMALFFQAFGADLNTNVFAMADNAEESAYARQVIGAQLATDVAAARQRMTPVNGSLQTRTQVQYLALDATSPWLSNEAELLPAEVQSFSFGSGADGLTIVGVAHEVLSHFDSVVRNAYPNPERVIVAGYSNAVEVYLPDERTIDRDRNSNAVGPRFEGHYAIYRYGWEWPQWTNGDLVDLGKGGSGRAQSAQFNGTSSYLQVPFTEKLNVPGAITIEAWIYPQELGRSQGIVERFGAYNSTSGGYDLRLTSQGKLSFFLGNDSTNPAEFAVVQGQTAIPLNQWTHVAGVYDGTQMRVYLNGVQDGSGTGHAPGTGPSPLIVGAKANHAITGGWFKGLIDEVRITGSALYTTSSFAPLHGLAAEPRTVGLWKFNGHYHDSSRCEGNALADAKNWTAVCQNSGVPTGVSFSTNVPRPAPASQNHALKLGKPHAHARVASSTALNITGSLTVEACISTRSAGTRQGIVERYRSNGVSGQTGGYALRLEAGRLAFYIFNGAFVNNVAIGRTHLVPNVWHHVAGVYDNGTLRVYVDGVLDGELASTTIAPGSGTSDLKIGAAGEDSLHAFVGAIDYVRVSSSARYSGNSFTPPSTPSADTDTRGLWTFDATGNDATTDGNDAALTPAASYEAVPAPSDNAAALKLAGTGYVKVPYDPSLQITDALTLEAWVKLRAIASPQSIIERFGAYNSGIGGYDLRIHSDGTVHFFIGNDSTSTSQYQFIRGTTPLTAEKWHHVAGVYDGREVRVYLDGVLENVQAATVTPGTGVTDVIIGAAGNNAATGHFLNGDLDEVRVTAAALYTRPEDSLCATGRPCAYAFTPPHHLTVLPDTRGLWRFDGNTLVDASPEGNDGTQINTIAFTATVPGRIDPASQRINVALARNGAQIEVPGLNPDNAFPGYTFRALGAIDGNRAPNNFDHGGGARTGLPGVAIVDFGVNRTIDEVDVITLPTNFEQRPVLPLLADTFTTYGMTDYVIHYSTDKTNWTQLQAVTGNSNVWRRFMFSAITARYLRVTCSAASNNAMRLIELEAWGQ